MIPESRKFCFIFSVALSLTIYTKVVPASCTGFTNETDRQALLALRSQILEPLGALSSWNDSINMCNWQGVSCSPRHQRVVALTLRSLKLAGKLSSYIGNLTFLKTVDLSNNSFHGTLPSELSHLYRLQVLFLKNNSFQGEIPSNLTQCLDLRIFVLTGNMLQGQIPPQLATLPRLNTVGLARNNLVGTIPPSFGNLSLLAELSLSENNLEGSIPTELGQLFKLNFLQLSVNNLSGLVPPQLYNLSAMGIFALAFNQLNGQLPDDLGSTLPNLLGLYLGGNHFSGPVPTSLYNCSRIVEVVMSQNALTGPIPDKLGHLQNLQSLGFDANKLGGPNFDGLTFLTSLANCSNLLTLTFFSNNLQGNIPTSIGNLSPTLTMLRLGQNYITGRIPSEIGNLAGLQTLELTNNMLSGTIPNSIGKLFKLQWLLLFGNSLSGQIPSSVGNITLLRLLGLQDNLLEGEIPESLGHCNYLERIGLSNNHLTGEIPKQILEISSLTAGLSLAGNNLTGSLPSEVSKLVNINSLDFSNNRLSGTIPSALESCQVLETLDISGNLFNGEIPHSFGNMRGIRNLDVSQNNLSGQIPAFLGEIALTYLNLSFNNFEGEVPTTGIFKNISAFSVIGNQHLCGGIKELKLSACPPKVSKNKRHISVKVIIPISIVLLIISLSIGFILIKYRIRKSKTNPATASLVENRHPRIPYANLFDATDGFSSTRLIGKGRFGFVYKGILPGDEQIVAVKVFNLQEQGADKTFIAECEALKAIRHRNLVKIITSCSSIDFQGNDFKALVFEFMPKGSLQSWLHPGPSEPQEMEALNLTQRVDIAVDVALALFYLHTQCDQTIVHCDLKPSNILLDGNFGAHVSDFGLTKSLSMAQQNSNHEMSYVGVRGTMGYIAPEYGTGEEVSTMGDMYSFGVLLMELFTGKSPTDDEFTGNLNLHDYVKRALPDHVTEIVDPLLLEEETAGNNQIGRIKDCLVLVFQIGVACSAHSKRERMNIQQVLAKLQKIRNGLLSSKRTQRG